MNRIIGKINNNRVEMVTITSGEPKTALINFVYNHNGGKLSKSEISKKIKKSNNKYYYNEYFISRGTK